MHDDTFVSALKALVLEAAEKPEPPGGLLDDEPLFGRHARVDFDSLDALQISMAIQNRYGVRMNDSKETRRAMETIEHLAAYLQKNMPKKNPDAANPS
ncbi:acyl carrier protein [Hydrogenophaga sp. PAMC20947]|uniref:acyl carrier protein n=1 Tax=Hydrogenophaga sp. PAMC20947 TaxID=2565558 RepID=UPI00109DCE9B|nr:acyl carrier protein [Hydrogenophaga sp. PAMC20947]QCB45007.1 acyl carrier protein [Hydrogenophaga sp. PAMC20947]